MKRKIYVFLLSLLIVSPLFSQQKGDTITVGKSRFVILSDNLIPNPGFESGFTGWTDATSSAATLTSGNFSLVDTAGVNNSKYLASLISANSSAAGSIGTGWNIESGKTYCFSYNVKYQSITAAAGSEIFLKISLTNDKTNVAEPVILIDTTKVNAAGVWTKNQVGFTNTFPYNYVVARFRWLGTRLGFDNFALHEAYEIPDTVGLRATIVQAQSLYDPSAVGALDLQNAISEAQSQMSNTFAIDVRAAIASLKDVIFQYNVVNATETKPLGITSIITNPSFESAFTGWNNNGFAAQSNMVLPIKDGTYYIEKWVTRGSKVPDISIEQKLINLPNGHYTLTAVSGNIQQAGSGSILNVGNPQTGATFYAGGYSMPVDTVKLRSLSFFVFDNQVSIGLKTKSATGNWVICDNFHLQYKGFDVSAIKSYLQIQVDTANVLLGKKMQDSVRAELNASVSLSTLAIANASITKDSLSNVVTLLQTYLATARSSITAYQSLQTIINTANTLYGTGSGSGADGLKAVIDEANTVVGNLKTPLTTLSIAGVNLNRAILIFQLANATGVAPVVATNPICLRGATKAFGRSTITGFAITDLQEHGFCWSTSPNPTVLDNRTTSYFSHNGYIYRMENLTPSTIYYVRAYAMTKGYTVGYGEVVKVITIPKGTATYSYNNGGPADANARIDAALKEATNYRNNLTSIQGLHITCSYGSGTPTADCGYGGSMRVGPNSSYQRTGTILHEMGHAIGVGTHWIWYGPSSLLRASGSRGIWLGERANTVVRFIENNNAGSVTGDAIHDWPTGFTSPVNYGINGANEDDGSELLYTANLLEKQALCEDGLIPTGGFCLPAYTFNQTDGEKYYIKSEEVTTGRDSTFLVLTKSGTIYYKKMTAAQALANDSAAWKISFNPVNCYYTIQNVATGKYITSLSSSSYNLIARPNGAVAADFFQFMGARIKTQIGTGANAFTTKGFWLIHPDGSSKPTCLSASANGVTVNTTFNIANTSTTQRWLLLSTDDVKLVGVALATTGFRDVNNSSVRVYSDNEQMCIDNIADKSDITVYNLWGAMMLKAENILSSYTHDLPKGVYVVKVVSDQTKDVSKLIIK